ncbi:MAG: hypothetical protein ACPGLV_09575, partial [Bacteroidia bacterium]
SSATGNAWVHFSSNSKRVVSINPQGENLGNVSVTSYVNTGGVRNHNNQYILDRSWVIDPQNQPNNPVKVRLYMLDTEVDALRNASGCANCTGIDDAFKLAFTKYHGTNEDSILTNNTSGTYRFFANNNVKIVPYGKGYCVELTVSSFSEIFASGGGLGGNTALPVEFTYFEAQWLTSAALSGQNEQTEQSVLLEWQTAMEENNSHFEVQRSFDALTWENIGKVEGQGSTFESSDYQFIDESLESKVQSLMSSEYQTLDHGPETVYYRLKQVDYNGNYDYSEIQPLNFKLETRNSFELWPNPSSNKVVYFDKIGNYIFKNTNGQVVLKVSEQKSAQLNSLLPGIYIIENQHGNQQLLVIQ